MEVHMSVILRPEFPGSSVPCKDADDDSAAPSVHAPPVGRSSETVWHELRTLDGRLLSRTHGLGHDGKWRWVTDNIKGDAECDYEDIDIEEADRDYITVKGARYAIVDRIDVEYEDFSNSAEHHEAMTEREFDGANEAALKEIALLKVRLAFMDQKYRAQVAMLEHQVDVWRDRAEASDQALESCIRDWNKEQRGEY
jgi:hypothetical protein